MSMTPCTYKDKQDKAKKECPKWDDCRTSSNCLHYRYDQWCVWVDTSKSSSSTSKSKGEK